MTMPGPLLTGYQSGAWETESLELGTQVKHDGCLVSPQSLNHVKGNTMEFLE